MLSFLFSRFGILCRWRLYPIFVSVEPTNVCNLRCPECPVGRRAHPQKQILIDLELVGKVFKQIKRYSTHTILYFQGEPLLHKRFVEIVSLAHRCNLLTSTSTNAQLIDGDMARSIVSSGLDRLIVSIDGTTQSVYETYRVGGSLEKALDGIRHIIRCRQQLNASHPLLEVQFLVLKSNEHQMAEMKKMARQLKVDKLTFKSAQLYGYASGHPQLTTIEKYARYKQGRDGKYYRKKKIRNHCKRLWEGVVVNSNGELLPCCFDKNAQYTFGNVFKDDFREIYNGDKAYRFRESILLNRKQFAMCHNCTS